ncbi:prepilin peptidase [Vibrio tapetis subsp. quintayensis]|uniref:A24 family peptidase n=1 Tax=Vibrio tapetis TaxID=52443 RepID=UPI0025B44236|nr:prepilin peptidase [Vibrio tapetis]MDN3680458.1 prepilin peptidase [Vibrio tapetis subsp. quintayensis]
MAVDTPIFFVLGPLLWISFGDLKSRTISHWACAVLLALWLVFAVSYLESDQIRTHLMIGFAALVGGFLLYALNIWGAGDGKLIALCLLWVGEKWPETLISVALLGGLLAAIYLLLARFSQTNHPLPYGVAIALGTLYQLSV